MQAHGNNVHTSSPSRTCTPTPTAVTNASRMLLMDLDALDWHEPTLAAFRCPRAVLPRIVSNSEVYGTISASGEAEGWGGGAFSSEAGGRSGPEGG